MPGRLLGIIRGVSKGISLRVCEFFYSQCCNETSESEEKFCAFSDSVNQMRFQVSWRAVRDR